MSKLPTHATCNDASFQKWSLELLQNVWGRMGIG